jgi:hypothetical protein
MDWRCHRLGLVGAIVSASLMLFACGAESITSAGQGGSGGAVGTGGPGPGGVGGSAGAGAAGAAGSAGAGIDGSVAGDDGGSPGLSCQQPMPIHVTSGVQTSPDDTGFDMCQSGAVHRRGAVAACPWPPPSASTACPASCQSDSDCVQSPLGVCTQAHQLAGVCGCYYGFCEKDADCGSGSICLCGGPVGGTCVPATCTSDSDCPAGLLCVSSSQSCHGGQAAFTCQSAADECLGDGDCPLDPSYPGHERCVLEAGKRSCVRGCL